MSQKPREFSRIAKELSTPLFQTPLSASYRLFTETGCRRSVAALARLRTRGGGPPFIQDRGNGDIAYPDKELLAWGRSQLSGLLSSTSEGGYRAIIPAGPGRGHKKPALANPTKPEAPARRRKVARADSVAAE